MSTAPQTTAEIRRAFLDYFKTNGHEVVDSSRVVPDNDPTLLFTNAGMVQFKDVFLGLDPRPYTRATSSQKCIRAGGKHNDLDNVGFTSRHHTFFEMMGNFSFGDYFKKEAIRYSWDFVTNVLKLPKDKLSVTVHVDDDEAAEIWHKQEGVPLDKIRRFDEDNFWSMGDTGPCGPCSEIFWDQGKEVDGERHLEFWNIVFMQYDRDASGKMTPLKKPSVDTGLGLERTASILQQVPSNYDIDLIKDLIVAVQKHVKKETGKDIEYDPVNLGWETAALRVIVDHLRSTSFLIADGVLPSNEGRGYVLRRILRRAVRFGKRLGLEKPFLCELYPELEKAMGDQYPELKERKTTVCEVLKQEEERFYETLDKGLHILESAFDSMGSSKTLPAKTAFQLYDSFGFPLDLTQLIAKERGFEVDEAGFDKLMQEQQKRSRASWKGSGAKTIPESVKEWKGAGVTTTPVFYETASCESKILSKAEVDKDHAWLAIEPCPFYAESGGQVADTGKITLGTSSFDVLDSQKAYDGAIAILVTGDVAQLKEGTSVSAEVDDKRRSEIRANHTGTHLLHAALRNILGTHVQQAGSLVNEDKLRFDFSHGKSISETDLQKIETQVNDEIHKAIPLNIVNGISYDEAVESGAMALFGEKYGDSVRVVDVPGYSKELCGGLHVKNTADIGIFRIVSESGVAAGTRRIEAETAAGALRSFKKDAETLERIAETLKSPVTEVETRIQKVLDHQKQLEAKIKDLENKLVSGVGASEKAIELQYMGTDLCLHEPEGLEPKMLRSKADQLRQQKPNAAHVIVCGKNILVTADQASVKGFHSGKFLQALVKELGGKGGGQDRLAQGVLDLDPKDSGATVAKWIKAST